MASGSFNKASSQYAQIAADGSRLKVWDVATGSALQEYVPTGQLAAEITCVGWCSSGTPGSAARTPKKQAKAASMLALGTAQGHVILWDVSRGELKKALGGPSEGKSSRVHDVAFGAGGATVFASSEDCQLTCWSAATGKEAWALTSGKQPARRIAMHPGEDLIATGGTAIKVWDLSTQTASRKFSGHASAISCLEFSPDGKYLLSSGGDRFLSLWDASSGGTEKAALMVFTLDSQPMCLSFAPQGGSDDEILCFLATSQAGSMGVWRVTAPQAGGKKKGSGRQPVAAGCRVTCEGKGDRVANAVWEGGEVVRVCRGGEALPVFEAVEVEDSEGGLKPSVVLARRDGGLLLGSAAKPARRSKGDAMEDVIGVADMPLNQANVAEIGGKKRRVTLDAELSEDDEIGSLDGEETLEDKVRALGLDGGGGTVGSIAPKAESVMALLMQALQSDDKQLLEQCLGVSNPRVINVTVAKLPPGAVSSLLSKVVGKFQARPTRSVNLVTWIRAILTQHTSYLMSQPGMVKTITPLYQLVESRVSTYHKLLKLEGRLELALSQVSASDNRATSWKEPDLTVHDEADDVDEVLGVDDESDEEIDSEEEEEEEGEEEEDAMDEDEDDDDDDEDDDDDDDDDDE